MEKFSALLRGIHRSPVNFPYKGQWRGASIFSLACALNKRLSKHSWGWWFKTPSCSLSRHCNVLSLFGALYCTYVWYVRTHLVKRAGSLLRIKKISHMRSIHCVYVMYVRVVVFTIIINWDLSLGVLRAIVSLIKTMHEQLINLKYCVITKSDRIETTLVQRKE